MIEPLFRGSFHKALARNSHCQLLTPAATQARRPGKARTEVPPAEPVFALRESGQAGSTLLLCADIQAGGPRRSDFPPCLTNPLQRALFLPDIAAW